VTPPKLYEALAEWWPLFSPAGDYEEEAASLRDLLRQACTPSPRTVVEFGSGGGSNAFHLKAHFTMTLVDAAPGMLAVSRTVNPECEHVLGDMRSVRLGRLFDAVFIHDAITYMTTEDDLRRAIEIAFLHCKLGGAAVLVPDFVREKFESSTEHGGRDSPERSLRYLEWTYDPDDTDTTYSSHFAFLLREGNHVRVEHDQHCLGLFPRAEWLRLLAQAGFRPAVITDRYGRDIFVASKPST
jgi:SAM-dependent methyltransferase